MVALEDLVGGCVATTDWRVCVAVDGVLSFGGCVIVISGDGE